ncbi:MAG: sensory box protein [Devosia sp.]|uniref:response regulator n=1 Tax=Devosia sp. TaxID=1871048 RepID=UPI00261C0241|nr:response regulator [Devosia sp.]MDB5586312.1 sensory box protein [Devosia sp.]
MQQWSSAERDAQAMPPVDAATRARWRGMLGTLAETMGMCDGRIWSLSGNEAEVIIAYGSPLPGEGMRVAVKGSRLLYQDVVRERSTLDVASPQWSGSSEAAQGIKDYLGLPITWPNGTLFGVIEVLTAELRPFTSLHRRLATQVRDNIDDHLRNIAVLAERTRMAGESRRQREIGLLAADIVDYGAWDYEIGADLLLGDAGWYRLLGLDGAEPLASLDDFKRLIHPDDKARITDANLLGLTEDAGGAASSVVFRLMRADGETRWVRSSARVLDGAPARTVGVMVDVTDSHMTDAALRQGRVALLEAEGVIKDVRERLQLAAGTSGLGIWEFNIDTSTLQGDASLCAIFGVKAGSLTGANAFHSRVHSKDRHLLDFKAMAQRIQEPRELEFRVVRPTGEIRWVSCTVHLSEASALLPKRLRGFVLDVTEAQRANEALNRTKAALHDTEKLVRLANWRFDRATQQFFASDMLYELNDSDPDAPALTQADLEQLLSPQSQDGATNAVQHCLKTGKPYALDVQYLRPDGTSFLASVRGHAERDAGGVIIGVVGTLQDMSEREEASARVAALAQALPLGAIYSFEWTDAHFMLTDASAGIEALIGVSAETLMADRDAFPKTMVKSERRFYLAEFERARQSGEVFDCRFNIVRPDGTTVWLHSRAVPHIRPDGTTGWDGVLRDIATERQSSDALRQAEQKMVAMEQAKDDLLATMSHEVRTPMNTVVGMTRLALQTELAPKQRNYLDKIDTAARSLQAIVSDVLDFSRIESGRLELDDSAFTLEAVLDTVSAATAPRAEEKGLELAFAVDADVPRSLKGDQQRLSQVLVNLVANAVKFTETGEVVVSVDRLLGDGGTPLLEFSIRDTGIELDANQIASLFRPFEQAASRSSPRHGGSGLGLSVCKRLVEQMGGTMDVQSQPGRDTTFRFTIALRPVDEAIASPALALSNRHVLIVDDNASARTILSDMLDELGMTPQTVASGSDALTALNTAAEGAEPFDLALIDWRMAGMDGLELARRLRADVALKNLPVVLMATGYGREDVLRRVDQLGLQGLLVKPVTQSMMLDVMADIFSPAGTGARNGLQPADTAAAQDKAALTDRRVLLVDDNTPTREAITDLLELAGVTVDTAASGSEALERLARRAYDAVLMDMALSDMAGREVTRRIRRNPAWTRLPIIALTGEDGLEDRDTGRGAGMTAHIVKPVEETRLYRVLADIFAGTKPVASVVAPDFDTALRRLHGDADRLERLMRGFVRDFADIPAKLGNLIGTDDLPETEALAQLVKTTAAALEARQLTAAATELEQAARDGDRDIDTLALEFRRHLQAVLDTIGTKLALDAQPHSGVERETALALIATVEPLVARGDDAADPMLKQLSALLDGQAEAAMIDAVRSAYDDVKLPAALAGLARLKAGLVHG